MKLGILQKIHALIFAVVLYMYLSMSYSVISETRHDLKSNCKLRCLGSTGLQIHIRNPYTHNSLNRRKSFWNQVWNSFLLHLYFKSAWIHVGRLQTVLYWRARNSNSNSSSSNKGDIKCLSYRSRNETKKENKIKKSYMRVTEKELNHKYTAFNENRLFSILKCIYSACTCYPVRIIVLSLFAIQQWVNDSLSQ